jgi:transportin-1
MAISCFPLLQPVVPTIMPSVIEQIIVEPTPDCVSVCNNAAWAVGEIALQYAGDASPLEPFIPSVVQRLVPILLNSKSPRSLSENAAVTIGRLGLVAPAIVAPDLATFAQAWCTALWEIKDNEEKDSAFRGFCMMITTNPTGIENVSRAVSQMLVSHTDELSRPSFGSATQCANGNTHPRSWTRCSDKFCRASKRVSEQAGINSRPPSLLSFDNVWRSDTTSRRSPHGTVSTLERARRSTPCRQIPTCSIS